MKFTRAHLVIHGRVQRVRFRDSARHQAVKLGLTGWVKNLSDGNVEAVIEGPENIVKEMIEWCKRGPVLAKVDGMDVNYEKYKGEFERFEVFK